MKITVLFFLFWFTVGASAKSLWDSGMNVYKLSLKTNEIVKIRFSDKTILKYKVEQRQNNYQQTKGKKGGGDLFSFFPDAAINENDTIRNQNDVSVNNESKFVIPAKVTAMDNDTVSIQGLNSSLMNGEVFRMEFQGEFNIDSLLSDYSVPSTEIYNLDFKVYKDSPTNNALFSENDLVYATNYTEIATNHVFDTNKNVTNDVVITNLSSMKVEFKGIQDSKKKGIIVNYLNFIVNSLFR